MAKQLNLDEMLDVLHEIDTEVAMKCQEQIEVFGTMMALAIAQKLGVIVGKATYEGTAFAGTCAPFYPRFEGQKCPYVLSQYDPEIWGDDESGNYEVENPEAEGKADG